MILVIGGWHRANAQEMSDWEPTRIIPGYSTEVLTPYLVADQNRTVHSFVSDWVGDEGSVKAIYYSLWRLDQGWSLPVDILLSPHHEARVKGAFLDPNGMLHVVFFGGEDNNAEIYYTQAPAVLADQAQAWSEPVIVGERAISPDEAAIAGDELGNLHIVFSAAKDGNSLYSVHSSDGGKTWSDPVPVFITLSSTLWPSHLQIYVDSKANLHAVWSVGDLSGNGLAVYYAKLAAGASGWTEPIVLAEAIGFEADTPSIIEYKDELFVIYHNDSPTTRWMRRSEDGGQTWSEPDRLFQQIGTNGAASMVIDNNGILHMFFGNRVTGVPIIYGLWHSTWLGNKWSTPVPIISGSKRDDFDPSFANAVVSQGNLIFVAWHQDPQAINSRGASFSYLILNAPENPVVPLSTEQTQSEVIPVVTNVQLTIDPTLTPQARDKISDFGDLQVNEPGDHSRTILIGVIPAIILIIFLFLYRVRTR